MEGMMETILEFHRVAKTYKKNILFENVDLNLGPGEGIGLLGPSGAGKSTLLKMAAGLVQPSQGQVKTGTCRIGYVFQDPRLLPWYTALENIVLVLSARGMAAGPARKTAFRFLDEMGLSGFEHHYPKELSGGMNQRVSIARALAISPELLLLDEPFTGLDPSLRRSIRSRVAKVAGRTNACIIHVTHARDELLPGLKAMYTLTPAGLARTTPWFKAS